MCWFLLLQIPANKLETAKKSLPADLKIYPWPAAKDRQSNGKIVIHITENMCSCGLYRDAAFPEGERESKQRQRYKTLGWSSAKIERAIKQTKNSREHKPKWLGRGVRPDLRKSLAHLVPELGKLKLLVCWTPSEPEVHALMRQQPQALAATSFVDDDGSVVPETPYEIHSSASQR